MKKHTIEKQNKALKTPEGRLQFVNSQGVSSLKKRFKKGKGIKRKESKETGDDIELVHTHRTLHNYSDSWHCFAKWVSINTQLISKSEYPVSVNYAL
ncbi:hypothetical protein Q7W37_03565 [Streptococcus suis]|nr:hypothetical protein [Streptococcus suis]